MPEKLTVHLFQCSPKSEASGSGTLTLTPGAGNAYSAAVDIHFAGVGSRQTTLSGSKVAAGSRNLIVLDQSSNPSVNIKVTLVDNPYIDRPTYGGCAALDQYIYNITATP